MGELQKRSRTFNSIVDEECSYSCWIGPSRKKKPSKPNREEKFVSMKEVEEMRQEFPSAKEKKYVIGGKIETDNFIVDLSSLRKDREAWFERWFGTTKK